MIDRVSWLHISDLHIRAAGDPFSQEAAAKALVDDIAGRLSSHTPPSFVLVTGDVGFSGLSEEYAIAKSVLRNISDAAAVPPERFYFVPGNHDVDRTVNRLHFNGACQDVVSQGDVDRVLATVNDIAPLMARQQAFWDFVDEFTGAQMRRKSSGGLGYASCLEVGGFRIAVVGLNSAWLSGKTGEEMTILIGERQVIELLELAQSCGAQLSLAATHHPLEWLRDWDQVICRERLLTAVHFFHRGHLHQPEVLLSASPEAPCLSIAAGSGHATRFYENSYNQVELDLGTGRCSIESVRYDPSSGAYQTGRTHSAVIEIGGPLPGSSEELSAALATNLPESAPYSAYFGALIAREKDEVPVEIGATVRFMTVGVARTLVGDQIAPAENFLRLRNLLRLGDGSVSLDDLVREHAPIVHAFVVQLDLLAARDASVATRIRTDRPRRTAMVDVGDLSYSQSFLVELRRKSEWGLIESYAPALTRSSDARLATAAKAALVDALMRSDETTKRTEAANLASELLADPHAMLDAHLLGAGAAEVLGDDRLAIDTTARALGRWPRDVGLREYARGLSLRTGDVELRSALEAAEEHLP